jgi:hypothetical protein
LCVSARRETLYVPEVSTLDEYIDKTKVRREAYLMNTVSISEPAWSRSAVYISRKTIAVRRSCAVSMSSIRSPKKDEVMRGIQIEF